MPGGARSFLITIIHDGTVDVVHGQGVQPSTCTIALRSRSVAKLLYARFGSTVKEFSRSNTSIYYPKGFTLL